MLHQAHCWVCLQPNTQQYFVKVCKTNAGNLCCSTLISCKSTENQEHLFVNKLLVLIVHIHGYRQFATVHTSYTMVLSGFKCHRTFQRKSFMGCFMGMLGGMRGS